MPVRCSETCVASRKANAVRSPNRSICGAWSKTHTTNTSHAHPHAVWELPTSPLGSESSWPRRLSSFLSSCSGSSRDAGPQGALEWADHASASMVWFRGRVIRPCRRPRTDHGKSAPEPTHTAGARYAPPPPSRLTSCHRPQMKPPRSRTAWTLPWCCGAWAPQTSPSSGRAMFSPCTGKRPCTGLSFRACAAGECRGK